MEPKQLRLIMVTVWTASLLVLAAALTALAATVSKPVADSIQQRGTRLVQQVSGEGKVNNKVNIEEAKGRLSDEQYNVCFNAATEAPFTGKYWDHHEDGAYHCVVCDTPLFSSKAKFDSGTGWPSFYEAVQQGGVTEHEDSSHGMRRVEVRCGKCGAHLGHIFNDGPKPTGMRYCINSASLEFRETE
jgi:peptide-methionine (R)-S-oxide reductase